MRQSIAAKYVARPAARFVQPSGRERERRLGLRSGLSFQPAAVRSTILRSSPGGVRLSGWQPVAPQRSAARSGLIRPAVTISWTGARRLGPDRRASLAPTPWRG